MISARQRAATHHHCVEERREGQRDEHRGGGLGDDPHEVDRVDVRAEIRGDREQRLARAGAGRQVGRSARDSDGRAPRPTAAIRPPNATSSTATLTKSARSWRVLASSLVRA